MLGGCRLFGSSRGGVGDRVGGGPAQKSCGPPGWRLGEESAFEVGEAVVDLPSRAVCRLASSRLRTVPVPAGVQPAGRGLAG